VYYFIDRSFKTRTIVLGIKRLYSPYSRENIAPLLIEILKTYNLGTRLGFCVLDNTSDNNIILRSVEVYLRFISII
jgi:hypothetical protein